MKVALALFRYFPHGGLQRDFLSVAQACLARGMSVTLLAADWSGPEPEDMELVRLPVNGASNHNRMKRFGEAVVQWRAGHAVDLLVGFNRLPGLDVYFASDSCFADQLADRPRLLKYLPRYSTYLNLEKQVCQPSGARRLLFLNPRQADQYLSHYPLDAERYTVLPPGLREDRRPVDNASQARERVRKEFAVTEDQLLVLFVGSGFRIKGLDRALLALGALPKEQKTRVRFVVAGADDPAPFQAQMERAGLGSVTTFAGGRDDVPELMQGADLLLHPAYQESAGMVLLEAAVSGLPVLTTATCGYAQAILEAGVAEVIPEPFHQAELDARLSAMLATVPGPWAEAGRTLGQQESLYRLHDNVAQEIASLGGAA